MVSNMTTNDGCGCAATPEPCGCGDLVAAGGVSTAGCTDAGEAINDYNLAVINFPVQTYVAGFCPCEALQYGTLFPELVSIYQRGC